MIGSAWGHSHMGLCERVGLRSVIVLGILERNEKYNPEERQLASVCNIFLIIIMQKGYCLLKSNGNVNKQADRN